MTSRTTFLNITNLKLTVGVLMLLLLPIITDFNIATEILVFSIFAIGFNFLAGYAGQLSFGHAAYFGLGAYITGLSVQFITANLYLSSLISLLAVSVVSIVFGRISLYRRGVYFAMITLALAQMVYFASLSFTNLTNGDNGLLLSDATAKIGPLSPLNSDVHMYLIVALSLVLVMSLIRYILLTPFGEVLVAIQQNEERTRHIGYNDSVYLLTAFTFSGAISGLAGTLFIASNRFVSPEALFWSTSGEVVLMTIIGGIGTLIGPVIGSFVFVLMSDILRDLTKFWPFFFGGLFVLVVILVPNGLYTLYERFRRE